ncbi:hypothetical protein LOD99_8507 [Oopsacas minuta]|uniref:CCHC-type domain-containing protein n=1 Tax=Oopsacas minuta TaxID=111878 RepID=A0AAV7JG13_9METZ|nr:hypothetical protein LOD99_8507 [Oopsacas minuta]
MAFQRIPKPQRTRRGVPPRVHRTRLDKPGPHPTWKRSDIRCFACGERGHMWRQCPERSCGNFGRRGHNIGECPRPEDNHRGGYVRRPVRGGKDRILIVEQDNLAHTPRKDSKPNDEDAVTLRVVIAEKEMFAILDTGGKPSVMARNTIAQLGLDDHIHPVYSHMFGLGQVLVPVVGKVNQVFWTEWLDSILGMGFGNSVMSFCCLMGISWKSTWCRGTVVRIGTAINTY